MRRWIARCMLSETSDLVAETTGGMLLQGRILVDFGPVRLGRNMWKPIGRTVVTR